MSLAINDKTFASEVLAASISLPVLVSFWAPWCGLCRMVDPLLQQIQADSPSPIKLVRINADDNFNLANTYRLTALPTVLLFADGQLLHRFDGLGEKLQLRDQLQQVLQNLADI